MKFLADVLAALFAAVPLWYLQGPKPAPAARVSRTHTTVPAMGLDGTRCLTRLPVAFVPNLGQWGHAARYVARIGRTTMFLEPDGWTLTQIEQAPFRGKERLVDGTENAPERGAAVRMTLVGARTQELVADGQLPGRHHYFLGNDPAKWRTDVPLYGEVRYREMQPGVDVRVREQDGHFEYDLILQPDALLEAVEIAVAGAERLYLDTEGALVMPTLLGAIRHPPPVSWEEGPSGERSPIRCNYELRGEDRFGFVVADRRPGWALVVDPGLVWSTYLGGSASEYLGGLAVDAQGAVTVAGVTLSADFPTTPGAFATSYQGYTDAFVTKLSPTGSSLVYSTFLGGSGAFGDAAGALGLDAQGGVIVAGSTRSTDFPTTPGAFDRTFHGALNFASDAFVTRLSPDGSSLVYSTFLGGVGSDGVSDLAVDGQDAAIVGGTAHQSPDFPTTPGAFDTTHNGGTDGFVTKLSPTGSSLVFSTFLGGSWGPGGNGGDDQILAVALDGQGEVTVAGDTWSADFPTTPGAFDTSFNGLIEAFVTRFTPTGSALVYSTYLGGPGRASARALAVDAQGLATIAGHTNAPSFPTTPGAFDTTFNGGFENGFVTRLSPTGSNLVYSTFLGGAATQVWALAVDPGGAATVAGFTGDSTFPTTAGAFHTVYSGNGDAFVTRLSPTGSSLLYSTFLSTTIALSSSYALALALDAQGAATVGGYTGPGFPTTPGAFSTVHSGIWEGFVTRLDMLPTGAAVFGSSSPGCTGTLAIGVTSMPQLGNGAFAITCNNAAPSTAGLIGFAGAGLPSPATVLGVDVWIDPALLLATVTVSSNPIGACEVPLPIPATPTLVGVQLFAQFVWLGPNAPPPCPPLGLSASNALDFTIQP